jgi:hypothetical protein
VLAAVLDIAIAAAAYSKPLQHTPLWVFVLSAIPAGVITAVAAIGWERRRPRRK